MLRVHKSGAIVVALAAAAAALQGGPASADTGDRTTTTSCGSFQSVASPGGPAHARARNCTVTWGKNIFDGTFWQVVSFQMIDSLTDGHCAQAVVQDSTTGADTHFSECNGVWTTKTKTYNTRNSWINILLNYGTSTTWFGITGGPPLMTPPSGF